MPEKVPIGCASRYTFIVRRAAELRNTFINGNRKDMLAGLEELEPRVAYAVLAEMVTGVQPEVRNSVHRFLMEAA